MTVIVMGRAIKDWSAGAPSGRRHRQADILGKRRAVPHRRRMSSRRRRLRQAQCSDHPYTAFVHACGRRMRAGFDRAPSHLPM